MKIEYRRKRLTPEQKVQLVSDYIAGIAIQTLLNRFGVSKATLYRILKEPIEKYEK